MFFEWMQEIEDGIKAASSKTHYRACNAIDLYVVLRKEFKDAKYHIPVKEFPRLHTIFKKMNYKDCHETFYFCQKCSCLTLSDNDLKYHAEENVLLLKNVRSKSDFKDGKDVEALIGFYKKKFTELNLMRGDGMFILPAFVQTIGQNCRDKYPKHPNKPNKRIALPSEKSKPIPIQYDTYLDKRSYSGAGYDIMGEGNCGKLVDKLLKKEHRCPCCVACNQSRAECYMQVKVADYFRDAITNINQSVLKNIIHRLEPEEGLMCRDAALRMIQNEIRKCSKTKLS